MKQEKLKSELIEKRRIALVAVINLWFKLKLSNSTKFYYFFCLKQDLMKETVLRIIDRERPNGLIIHKAIYGKIIDKNK